MLIDRRTTLPSIFFIFLERCFLESMGEIKVLFPKRPLHLLPNRRHFTPAPLYPFHLINLLTDVQITRLGPFLGSGGIFFSCFPPHVRPTRLSPPIPWGFPPPSPNRSNVLSPLFLIRRYPMFQSRVFRPSFSFPWPSSRSSPPV